MISTAGPAFHVRARGFKVVEVAGSHAIYVFAAKRRCKAIETAAKE